MSIALLDDEELVCLKHLQLLRKHAQQTADVIVDDEAKSPTRDRGQTSKSLPQGEVVGAEAESCCA